MDTLLIIIAKMRNIEHPKLVLQGGGTGLENLDGQKMLISSLNVQVKVTLKNIDMVYDVNLIAYISHIL